MSRKTAKTDAEKLDSPEAYRATETELRAEFPQLFAACDSLSCPPGWYTIARALSRQIVREEPAFRVLQVKPKAGSLRYYYSAAQNLLLVNRLIDLASSISAHTCEACGSPGSQRGWNVYCDGCAR